MPLFGPPNVNKLKANRDVKGLVKALEYRKDNRIRCDAAHALGELDQAESLNSLLQNSDPDVRQAAADALQVIHDRRAARILAGDYEESDRAEVIAMGKEGVDLLARAIVSSGIQTRRRIIETLKDFKDESALAVIVKALSDNESAIRLAVVRVLGEMGGGRVVEPLILGLKDSAELVRLSAVEALGKTGDRRAIDPLVAKMDTRDLKMRQAIIQALDVLGWQPTTDRWGAYYWVGKGRAEKCVGIGAPAVDAILEKMQDTPSSRVALIPILGEINDERVTGAITPFLKAEQPELRLSAVEALGKLNDARLIDPLLPLLEDKDKRIRLATLKAIRDFKDGRIFTALVKLLDDPEGEVREKAITMLGESGDTAAIEPLTSASNDKRWEIRESAVMALTHIDDRGVVPPLINALQRHLSTKEEEVVLDVLARRADARAVQPLVALLTVDNFDKYRNSDEIQRVFDRRSRVARALVEMYRSGKLDQEHKKMILDQRDIIKDKEAIDQQWEHSDHGSGSCHEDDQATHNDLTYPGVDFPL